MRDKELEEETKIMACIVTTCNCVNKFQDELYGKGRRLLNSCSTEKRKGIYRCTVCDREQSLSFSQANNPEEKPKTETKKKGKGKKK